MDPTTSNGGKSPWNYALSGKIMLSAIVVLFTVVLLILFLHLYVRWHVIRRASRQARRRRRLVFSGEGQTTGASTFNRGLDPSILASLSVLLFSSDGGQDDEYVECAVCLNEFKEEEKIRCLPKCSHRFHVECIDMWFCSHSTCPLCRTAVEAVKQTAADASGVSPTGDHGASLTDSANNEFNSSRPREEEMSSSSSDPGFREVRVEIPAARVEVSGGQTDSFNLGLESPEQQSLKSSSIRIVLIRWLLMRDLRIHRVSVPDADLERGERISPSS